MLFIWRMFSWCFNRNLVIVWTNILYSIEWHDSLKKRNFLIEERLGFLAETFKKFKLNMGNNDLASNLDALHFEDYWKFQKILSICKLSLKLKLALRSFLFIFNINFRNLKITLKLPTFDKTSKSIENRIKISSIRSHSNVIFTFNLKFWNLETTL